ncbi:uracil-DNA glycosylase family protein [Sphingosinicella sp.]|uniref:uracil-DNA glycosylase family protein n=1 Tax=Sphingosinicella sp. TaxID=1917971 RepID=UPI00403795EE
MNAQLAASALAWWSEAGVDTLVAEEPRNWLRPKTAPTATISPEAAPVPDLPDTLDAFQLWLRTAALPFPTIGSRLDPTGDPFSGLMVMTDMPAPNGGWFEAEADPLFDRMMTAIGRGRDRLYLASLSPARSPQMRLEPVSAQRLADIARHHIGLVRPRALLLFGDMCAQALLGGSVARTRGRWHALETPGGSVRTLATIRPEQVARQPSYRKIVWEDLQLLMEELAP